MREKKLPLHSLAIIRNGYLVLDAYWYPFAPGSMHDIASVTKSITSTLIGIAVDQGRIRNVHEPIRALLKGRAEASPDLAGGPIRLEHLLSMTSGWDCGYKPGEPELFAMLFSSDWVRYTLDLPMKEAPGSRFAYCSSGVFLLAVALREATGLNALEFARAHLFDPLGIGAVVWPANSDGDTWGWGDLRMQPLDLARIGYLFLQQGIWKGRQVVSSQWISEATRSQVLPPRDRGSYGYLWWLQPGMYAGRGRGGQSLLVLPDRRTLIVATAGGAPSEDFLTSEIVPAIVSDTSLAKNPSALRKLNSKLRALQRPPKQGKDPKLSEMAGRVSGRKFRLDQNLIGLQSFTLKFHDRREAVLELSFDGLYAQGILELPIGLDGVYRSGQARYGMPAALMGHWRDDDVFVLDFNEIGNINHWTVTLAFRGRTVQMHMEETTYMPKLDLRGTADVVGDEPAGHANH